MMQVATVLGDFDIRPDIAKSKIADTSLQDVTDPFQLATVAMVYFRTKDYTSALKWIEKAIARGGLKYPSITEQAGDILYMAKKAEQAIEYWKQAKKMGVSSSVLDRKISNRTYVQ